MGKKRFYILASMLSIAAVLVLGAILLLVISGRRATNNAKTADKVATETQDKKKTAENAVNSFYNWYIRQNTDIFSDKTYKNRGTLTDELVAKIEKSAEDQKDTENKIDPVICGQGMPDTMTVSSIDLKGEGAVAEINLNYIKSRKVKLSLVLRDSQWRISDIICQ